MSECKRKKCNKLAKETDVVDSQDPERRAPKSEVVKYFAYTLVFSIHCNILQ